MPGRIQQELQQRKPLASLEEEAVLNLQRTADLLMQSLLEVLRPWDLTPTQYNVLRILRGAGEDGANCKEIAARMVTRDPDITRLLDRLDKRELVSRSRAAGDRRYASIRITPEGLRVLSALDEPIVELSKSAASHLGPERLHALIASLEDIREHTSASHAGTVTDTSDS